MMMVYVWIFMMMVRLDNYDYGILLDIYDDGTFGHLIVLVRLRIY